MILAGQDLLTLLTGWQEVARGEHSEEGFGFALRFAFGFSLGPAFGLAPIEGLALELGARDEFRIWV